METPLNVPGRFGADPRLSALCAAPSYHLLCPFKNRPSSNEKFKWERFSSGRPVAQPLVEDEMVRRVNLVFLAVECRPFGAFFLQQGISGTAK